MNVLEFVQNVVIPSVYAESSWRPSRGATNANDLVKNVLNLILIVVVVAAVIYIMFAGVQYVTSQGDPTKAKQAMGSITNAIIGLIVSFAAYALIQLVVVQLDGKGIDDLPSVEEGTTGANPVVIPAGSR
ncbi:hypothetical protein IT418_01110 [bacterium]|nr:hypothetical protein [bacterium]